MKITYTPNPLCSVVELDQTDLEILRLKITIDELKERVYGAFFHLDEKRESYDPAKALAELDVDGLEDIPLKERIDQLMTYFVGDLLGRHGGDCTCVPASCGKCHAESLLGINTIEGLGKHSAIKIDSAFRQGVSIDDAIERLENYKAAEIVPGSGWKSKEQMAPHIPRWTAEAKAAAAWLREYRDKHFAAATNDSGTNA